MSEVYDETMRKILETLRLRAPVEGDAAKMREAMRRAQKAKQLRDDPDLKQAFEMVEGVYMSAWRLSDALDVEKRERCHMVVSLLADLRNYLIACVENGEAARREMEKIANR